jgi:hypothetical protein
MNLFEIRTNLGASEKAEIRNFFFKVLGSSTKKYLLHARPSIFPKVFPELFFAGNIRPISRQPQ